MNVIAPQRTSERLSPSSVVLRDMLRRLPTVELEVISLARIENLTYREVASVLGITEDTAKRRICSGLRRLRAEMVRAGMAAS